MGNPNFRGNPAVLPSFKQANSSKVIVEPTAPQRLVNIYCRQENNNWNGPLFTDTLVVPNIALKAMAQLSKRFVEDEKWNVETLPGNENVVCFHIPTNLIPSAAVWVYFTWFSRLKLPLSNNYKGKKHIGLKEEWGIQEWSALYQLTLWLDLQPQYSNRNLRDKIRIWLETATLHSETDMLIKLYHRVEADTGLQASIVYHSFQYAKTHNCLDDFSAVFSARSPDLFEAFGQCREANAH